MSFDQILKMIVNQVIRHFVNRGVNAGMERMGRMTRPDAPPRRGHEMAGDMDVDLATERQRRQEQQAIRQARRAARAERDGGRG